MKKTWIALLLSATASLAQTYQTAPPEAVVPDVPTAAWIARIAQLAPARATAKPARQRAVLLFSLTTGFQHYARPYAAEVIKTLADKTGAFTVVESLDIESFAPESLAKFDAVILNNCCPNAKNRNLFLDVLNNTVDKSIKDIGWSQISNATVRQPFRPRTTDASSAGKTSKCFRDIALRRCASELLAGVGFSRVAIEV
jgi:hypothetical protein